MTNGVRVYAGTSLKGYDYWLEVTLAQPSHVIIRLFEGSSVSLELKLSDTDARVLGHALLETARR